MSDDKLLDRVRALLAQAEHPNTSQMEAEAFTERATVLMAKYGIDQALLADRAPARDEVGQRRFGFAQPYTHEKADLLASVAYALRCKVITTSFGRVVNHATVFGFTSDLERVELLYTSLLLQATRDVLRAEVPYYEQTAPFRRTWLVGFASAVGRRIRLAEQRAATDAEHERGSAATSETVGRSVELVLADRSAIVEQVIRAAYPKVKTGRRRSSTGGGMAAGYRAGQRADIGSTRIGSNHQQIGGAR
ncbi:DUF2786 domain-containing protein [Kutzneria viridogrisea]|uniref:DUF2786 domain-containing protein n=1 Tax=Kutzneria viridogrisea TaxID=47990 RepID=A0ABR6BAZ6_9PSEU|nr:hypothetical protein [Kutzneria viridogrisea]